MSRSKDLFGGFLAALLVLLLAVLVTAQFALSIPSWRLKLSLVDRLEGRPWSSMR